MKNKTKQKFILVGGVIIVVIILSLIFLIPNSNYKAKLIDVDEFEKLAKSEDVFIINTHTPYVGEINGTDLIAENWENMALYKNSLPKNKNQPIAVYCRSGRMSAISAKQLLDMGYKNVYDLNGGMRAWTETGRKLIINNNFKNSLLTGKTKEFIINVSRWKFSPNKIEVNLGDRVLLHITSIEGDHGIALYDFDVNEFLTQSNTIDVEFIADKKGTFNFFCNVMCGKGHGEMNGELIVN